MKKTLTGAFIILIFLLAFSCMVFADIPAGAGVFQGHYYYVYPSGTVKKLDEAIEYCKAQGGHLATITSDEENTFIYNYMIKQGETIAQFGYRNVNGKWIWIDGTISDYTNWNVGEPEGQEIARFKSGYDGLWVDDSWGNFNTSFICEWEPAKPTPEPTSPSTPVPKEYTDYTGQGLKPLTVTDTKMETTITTSTKEEISGSSYPLLQARATNVKETSFTLKWNKLPRATKYIIYGNRCGKKNKYEYVAETKKTSYKAKKLKKKKFYKYLVVAAMGDKVISVSKTVHVGLIPLQNPTKLTVNKKKVTLTAGKPGNTFGIKCKIKGTTLKQHRDVKYETDNVKVAKVNSKGKIKAVGKGTCNIYAYAQNGVSAKIQVKVIE